MRLKTGLESLVTCVPLTFVHCRWNSCTMKKWLKDHNLQPGSGLSHHIATKDGMMVALTAFKEALSLAGVRLEHSDDTSSALLSLLSGGDTDHHSDDDSATVTTARKKKAQKRAGKVKNDGDEDSSEDGGNATSVKKRPRKSTIDGIGGETDHSRSMDVDRPDSCVQEPDSVVGAARLPVHLRPRPIIISSATAHNGSVAVQQALDGGGKKSGYLQDNDESTSELVEILNQLKQNTPVAASQPVPSHAKGDDSSVSSSSLIANHLDNLAKSRKKNSSTFPIYLIVLNLNAFCQGAGTSDSSGQPAVETKTESVVTAVNEDLAASAESRRGKKKSVQYKTHHSELGVAPAAESLREDTSSLLEDIYSSEEAPGTPTSMSVYMVDSMLSAAAASSVGSGDSLGESRGDAPIESLQYFKYLNQHARRLSAAFLPLVEMLMYFSFLSGASCDN